MALVTAVTAAYGVFLLYTARVYRWRGIGPGPRLRISSLPPRRRLHDWMTQAGLGDVRPAELLAVMAALLVAAAVAAYALFGGVVAPLVAGCFAASFPVASARGRRLRRRAEAREAWPRLIEEIRLLTGAMGRSVPQALFEAGHHAPQELRAGFAAAHREWLLSVDFARTTAVLKRNLADPTADAACETLLVAYEVGGSELDRRLAALIEDRIQDLQGRKDAQSRQAGVRFARRFVLLVPLGMALAGLSIGNGRAAYTTRGGQLGVGVGLLIIVLCWVWAGRLLRLPEEARVFDA